MPLLLDTLNLEVAERLCVTAAMNAAGGCKTWAANLLGISRTALGLRLKRHTIVLRNSVWAPETPCT